MAIIIILLSNELGHTEWTFKNYALPYAIFFSGLLMETVGSILHEKLFREFEISVIRFYSLDGLVNFVLLSLVIYPLVSLIKCDHFSNFMSIYCTNNWLDHPIYAFHSEFVQFFSFWKIICLILLCVSFNVYTFSKLKLTKKISLAMKTVLDNIRFILIFIVEIFLFNLPELRNGNLSRSVFILVYVLRMLGLALFALASLLIFEVLPFRFFGLDKHFGKYMYQVENGGLDSEEEDFDDLDTKMSTLNSVLYSESHRSSTKDSDLKQRYMINEEYS